jgi:hypothetical protein
MCSVGLGYGLGVGQVALLGMVVLCYPAAKVQTYVYTPCVVNGSLSRGCGHVGSSWADLAPACGVLSAAVAAFVIATFNKAEGGGLGGDFTAEAEAEPELRHWGLHFWFVAGWAHCVLVVAGSSPAHLVTAAGAGMLMTYGLARICRPADPERGTLASAFAGMLIYIAGMGLAVQSIPPRYPNRGAVGAVVLLMDYILGMGHVWDRTTSMQTVANCRVAYASACALLLAGVYAGWPDLATPSASRDGD